MGSKGSLFVNDDHLVLHSGDSLRTRFDFSEALSAGSHHPEWMEPVVRNFGREIMETRYRGANFRETWWCSHLINLAYRSDRAANRVIDVCNPILETLDS